jgi:N-acetylmuramoyl-L-alanine amidase
VVIDPGHQSSTDQLLEPIGPGSTEQKARMTAGATGLMSGVPEYEINLEIATNLQKRLEAAGVRVVMTRTTNDVDVSNAERAQIANRANADLFIRLHADSSTDPSAVGVSTVYPDVNTWTKPIVASSRKAAIIIQQRLLSSTSARDDGSSAQSDIAGFNWAKVPAVLVRAGFQSNSVEDQLLSSARYQDLLAQGMADGVLAYLNGGR